MRAQRQAASATEAAAVQAHWQLADAARQLREARLTADADVVAQAVERHAEAVRQSESADQRRAAAWAEVNDGIGAFIGAADQPVVAGLDRTLPIALLPVRLETRFHDTAAGVELRVRIYPDDVHIDDHEPALTEDEVALGQAYWTAIRRDAVPEPEAWTTLAAVVGPYRALWVRQSTEPTADFVFPEVPLRAAGTARASVARALPDAFIVRVRVGGRVLVAHGAPVADAPQVGVDMSAATSDANLDGEVIVLAEGMRWMAEYDRAEASGMAVAVTLPAGTRRVDDVTVVGVCVSMDPGASGELLTELIARHRVTDGAGFIAPGTPTNNLSDTSSGYTERPDPARLDPFAQPVAGPISNAAVLGRALGLTTESLAHLGGAADTDNADARAMQAATFEATWGPYLRQHAQPAFPVKHTPEVYQHLVGHVRGGGPLPALRLGRQPYGLLPVQPTGWRPHGEGAVAAWLGQYLPRIRQLWLTGFPDAPIGLAMYSHEAVSSCVRIRTSNASYTGPLGVFDDAGNTVDLASRERQLAAELSLGDALPYALRNLYRKDPARLWLPMSADGDLALNVLDPQPKQATSVLGLLLRNAALQVTSAAADEWRAGMDPPADRSLIGYQVNREPDFAITAAAGVAVSTNTQFDVIPRLSRADKLAATVIGPAGEATVADQITRLATDAAIRPDIDRYLFSDAVRAFLDAVAELERIPTATRARLVGEALDIGSHRYDAWVTSLATQRLGQLRSARPEGIQLGAWGFVHGVSRRRLTAVPDRPDLPAGVEHDTDNKGFVLASSLRHATVAGVLRAAWAAHGADPADAEAPFATDLHSRRVRRSLDLATGMRNGQQLGALLGYQIERDLHESSGAGLELDALIFELRRQYPLRVDTGENAAPAASRLVTNGWRIVQAELDAPGSVVAAVAADRPASEQEGLQRAVNEVITALDGLTDLGLAEAVYQYAGRNVERAAAATDMIGRAAVPPESFDVAATPRGGRGIEQRVIVTFGDAVRPAGWASNTPRARLAPAADAFVAERLGAVDALTIRLLDADLGEAGRCVLADLGLSALDLGADAANTKGEQPFPLLLARASAVIGVAGEVQVALDDDVDGEVVALLEHAAAWHRALAARPPVTADSFTVRAALTAPSSFADVLAEINTLAQQLNDAADDDLARWGLFLPADHARQQIGRRLEEVAAATDPVRAARALFGSDAVVTGHCPAPPVVTDVDQAALGVAGTGAVEGWIADTGRVRTAVRALDDALLADDLADRAAVPLTAAQSPATPYLDEQQTQWLGLPSPGPLGAGPAVCLVITGDTSAAELVGLELDAWAEIVPDRAGVGAVAANLSAPDSRAPNTILLAVPADATKDWTEDAVFSVVDEAMELARCRMVDLDASKRAPALLPACFIADYDEPSSWWQVVSTLEPTVSRYRHEVSG